MEAAGLTAELAAAAGAAAAAISEHMAREEAAVLPLLTAGLCRREQRAMVWRTLRAMPLRLLERVLPWLAGAGPRRTGSIDRCGGLVPSLCRRGQRVGMRRALRTLRLRLSERVLPWLANPQP